MNGVLTINLENLAENYCLFQDEVGSNSIVAPVVKANAYGCGLSACASKLHEFGARHYFVATLPEALELRSIVGAESFIYMLGGFLPEYAHLYSEDAIIPVLNDLRSLKAYRALAFKADKSLPAIVHIDTGMNRLGFESEELDYLDKNPEFLEGLDIHYVMSHLVSSEVPNDPFNYKQLSQFERETKRFSSVPRSLANSSGIFLGEDYHFDMVRPGMALYGLNPTPHAPNPMKPVVSVKLPVLQIRTVDKNETCGYNATHRFDAKTRLAILAGGYADGILRSGSGVLNLYWKRFKCPVRGRISMDTIIVDLSNITENELPAAGDHLELIGPHQSPDELAKDCGTIGYEILTSLSRRYVRKYIG